MLLLSREMGKRLKRQASVQAWKQLHHTWKAAVNVPTEQQTAALEAFHTKKVKHPSQMSAFFSYY